MTYTELEQAALDFAHGEGWTPPAPPPVAVPLFDGRATVTKAPLPTTSGSGQSTTQTPPMPYLVWDGYEYMGSDVTLATDPRWGLVYYFAPAAGHHSPAWTGATPNVTQAYLAKRRPTGLGETYWWSESICVVSSDGPDWSALMSLGYQTVLNDQIALGLGGTGLGPNTWSLRLNSGLVASGKPAVSLTQGLRPLVLGQWADFVIGAHIAADNTGWVEPHYRPQGGTWTKLPGFSNVPTVEWTNATGAPQVGATVLDKSELYFGWWSQTKSPAPTGGIRMRGPQRWGTLADAIASLGI